jgi:hypothetical protein
MAQPFLGVDLPDAFPSDEKAPAGGGEGDTNADGGAPAGADAGGGSEAPAGGDGFEVHLTKNDIVELTGKIIPDSTISLNIKQRLQNAISQTI